MRGCSRGEGGHAWLLRGGRACVVAPGGWGACMVAPGGAWLLRGGTCVVALGGCMAAPGGHARLLWGGVHGFFNEIWSMSGWYASYWNAFLFLSNFTKRYCNGDLFKDKKKEIYILYIF